MRSFKYLGDREAVSLWGITFPQGVPVPVSDPHALRKLAGNSHFAEVLDGFEIAGDVIDGAVDDLDALRAEAEAKGIKVDGRWKAARLRDEIARA